MTPEDIVAHVNTYQAGAFFAALLPWLAGDPLPAATAPLARFGLVSRLRGIGLTLYRLDLTSGGPLDAVVIAQVRFYPAAVLPYGLDAATETRASATGKLSRDTAEGGDRVSHFLTDDLVVVTAFRPGGVGLEEVSAVRLGGARRTPSVP